MIPNQEQQTAPKKMKQALAGTSFATATVPRLLALCRMIRSNREAYYRAIDAGNEPSQRLYRWLDEYDAARGTAAWLTYCKQQGFDPSHRALDGLA